MNFLDICKRVNNLVGFQGVLTSVSPTGYQAVLVNAVKDAWEDIQRHRVDWDFMRATKSVNVDGSQNYYSLDQLWGTAEPDLGNWLYVSYDYQRLMQLSYDAYEGEDFTAWTGHKPYLYAIDPATKGLYISPVDANYTLDIYYTKELQNLTTATQVPWLPERYHQAIVYGAVVKLATFVGNPTLHDTYALKYDQIMGSLMREENPPKFVRKRPVA